MVARTGHAGDDAPGDVVDVVRRRVVVTGRVQGVGFRFSTEGEADRLALAGWVRNAPDGSVELEAEGPPETVDELVAWLRTGPPGARVDDVAVTDASPTGEAGFTTRR